MREEFLHFLWQFRLFELGSWSTTEGESLEVINPGQLNHDSGPDFLNARIRVGETEWAGNVEFHLHSGDWLAHGHQGDRAYDNLILHVVYSDNSKSGPDCPTWVCAPFVPKQYEHNWAELRKSKEKIPCARMISQVDLGTTFGWTERLAIQRLERKSAEIMANLQAHNGDFRVAFYLLLMRYFGFKVNNDAFEMLARSLPLSALEKHAGSLHQVEALLFGQAGFLEDAPKDEYQASLHREFSMLRSKFGLTPLKASIWKFSRLMPRNFPTIRLAQMAAIVHSRQGLMSITSASAEPDDFVRALSVPVSDYWTKHYAFGKALSKPGNGKPGKMSIDLIIINVVVPFKFVLGKYHNKQELIDQAIRLLENLSPEENAVIRMWNSLSLTASNALDSQGMLELKNEYCNKKRCLNCRIGQLIIKKEES